MIPSKPLSFRTIKVRCADAYVNVGSLLARVRLTPWTRIGYVEVVSPSLWRKSRVWAARNLVSEARLWSYKATILIEPRCGILLGLRHTFCQLGKTIVLTCVDLPFFF